MIVFPASRFWLWQALGRRGSIRCQMIYETSFKDHDRRCSESSTWNISFNWKIFEGKKKKFLFQLWKIASQSIIEFNLLRWFFSSSLKAFWSGRLDRKASDFKVISCIIFHFLSEANRNYLNGRSVEHFASCLSYIFRIEFKTSELLNEIASKSHSADKFLST